MVTNAGAEVLPFLGAYAVLPGSILFYMYHERLVRRESDQSGKLMGKEEGELR